MPESIQQHCTWCTSAKINFIVLLLRTSYLHSWHHPRVTALSGDVLRSPDCNQRKRAKQNRELVRYTYTGRMLKKTAAALCKATASYGKTMSGELGRWSISILLLRNNKLIGP